MAGVRCRVIPPKRYAVLGATQRRHYAYPGCWKYPIHDAKHTRLAASRFARFGDRIPEPDRADVAARIDRAKQRFGIGKYRENPIMAASSEAKQKARPYVLAAFQASKRGDKQAENKNLTAARAALGVGQPLNQLFGPDTEIYKWLQVRSARVSSKIPKSVAKSTKTKTATKPPDQATSKAVKKEATKARKTATKSRAKAKAAEAKAEANPTPAAVATAVAADKKADADEKVAAQLKAEAQPAKPARKSKTTSSGGGGKMASKKKSAMAYRMRFLTAKRQGDAAAASAARENIKKAGYTISDDGTMKTKAGNVVVGPPGGKAAKSKPKTKSASKPKAKSASKPKTKKAKAAASGGAKTKKRRPSQKPPAAARLPKGFKKTGAATTVEGKKGKQVIVVTRTKKFKENPFGNVGTGLVMTAGGVLGAIAADMLGRFIDTMPPEGAKDPRRREHAAAAILQAPSGLRLAAQGGVALVGFGGAWWLAKKNKRDMAAFALGWGIGAAVTAIKDAANAYVMPAVFKTSKPGEQPTFGDRMYYGESKEAQDSLKARVQEMDKVLAGKAGAAGTVPGLPGQVGRPGGMVAGLPEGNRVPLPAMAPSARSTTVQGQAQASNGQVGNPGGSGQVGCGCGCNGAKGGCGGNASSGTLPPGLTTPALPMAPPVFGSMPALPGRQGVDTPVQGTPMVPQQQNQQPMIHGHGGQVAGARTLGRPAPSRRRTVGLHF